VNRSEDEERRTDRDLCAEDLLKTIGRTSEHKDRPRMQRLDRLWIRGVGSCSQPCTISLQRSINSPQMFRLLRLDIEVERNERPPGRVGMGKFLFDDGADALCGFRRRTGRSSWSSGFAFRRVAISLSSSGIHPHLPRRKHRGNRYPPRGLRRCNGNGLRWLRCLGWPS
jgi:hypothetical protein